MSENDTTGVPLQAKNSSIVARNTQTQGLNNFASKNSRMLRLLMLEPRVVPALRGWVLLVHSVSAFCLRVRNILWVACASARKLKFLVNDAKFSGHNIHNFVDQEWLNLSILCHISVKSIRSIKLPNFWTQGEGRFKIFRTWVPHDSCWFYFTQQEWKGCSPWLMPGPVWGYLNVTVAIFPTFFVSLPPPVRSPRKHSPSTGHGHSLGNGQAWSDDLACEQKHSKIPWRSKGRMVDGVIH